MKVHACCMIYVAAEIYIATICQPPQANVGEKKCTNILHALTSIDSSFPLSARCLSTDMMTDW